MEEYDKKYVPIKFGLNNTGVICHLNSLLQGIASCPAVIKTTLSNYDYLSRTITGKAFYEFISKLHDGSPSVGNYSIIVLKALITDLRKRRPHFQYGPGQESASEGLVLLLDMMDVPHEKNNNPISHLFYHRYQAIIYCRDCEKSVSKELDVAVQFNMFYLDTLKTKPQTPEEFTKLLLTQASILEDYRCDDCKVKNKGIRYYILRMIPEVLVILFNIYHKKINHYIPDHIEFPSKNKTTLNYRRVSQIEHFGSRGGGHYISRGIRSDGDVYVMNDSMVQKSEFKQNPNIYMVFYHLFPAEDVYSAEDDTTRRNQ